MKSIRKFDIFPPEFQQSLLIAGHKKHQAKEVSVRALGCLWVRPEPGENRVSRALLRILDCLNLSFHFLMSTIILILSMY
jgi:hypothetical protein